MKYLAALAFLFCTQSQVVAQQRPNFIFIYSDDHDADAISAYNRSLIRTPGIDRLAAEGMLFTHHFVANAICAPARATILTGKFSHRNGHRDNHTAFDTAQYLFPRQLQRAGYQTALVGKWHLQSLPSGFNYWEVLPGQGNYYATSMIDQGGDTTVYAEAYATSLITDKSIQWLERRNKHKPFLLMVQHKAPHRQWWPEYRHALQYATKKIPEPASLVPDSSGRGRAWKDQQMRILDDMSLCSDLKVAPEYLKEITGLEPSPNEVQSYQRQIGMIPDSIRSRLLSIYARRGEVLRSEKPSGVALLRHKYQWYMQDYLACIASVDEGVARLLNYLDDEGIAEQTVVVYTSDQGFYLGENGWFDKRFMYDVSMQSPLLLRWKGRIQGGSRCDALTQNIDIAPTFLDLAGLTPPAEVQGVSMRPLLEGRLSNWNRDALYYHYYEYPIDHHVYPHLGVRTRTHKLIYFYTLDEWELYDLERDPTESKNLYGKPASMHLTATLKERLIALRREYGDQEKAGILD